MRDSEYLDEKRNFPVGTRVICTSSFDGKETIKNASGIVVFNPDIATTNIGVRFDDNIGGHDCQRHCDFGHGWFCPPSILAIDAEIPDETIEAAQKVAASLI